MTGKSNVYPVRTPGSLPVPDSKGVSTSCVDRQTSPCGWTCAASPGSPTLFKEAGQPRSGRSAPFHAPQLCAHPPVARGRPGDGGRRDRSAVERRRHSLFVRLRSTWHEHGALIMAKNEKTSKDVASIAAQALRNPSSITKAQVQKLAGSVLTQAPDRTPPKPRAPKPSVGAKKKP